MREILFRGKKLLDGVWKSGSLVNVDDECVIIPEYAKYLGGSDFSNGYEVDPATVGQYTGLTDKNGQRIFEGDIANFKTTLYLFERCAVEYFESDARFIVKINGRGFPMTSEFEYEVIGNIHDNPELLEVVG